MARMIAKLKDLATHVLEQDVELEKIRRRRLAAGRVIATLAIIVATALLIRYSFNSGYIDGVEVLVPIILLVVVWQEDPRSRAYRLACRQTVRHLKVASGPEGILRWSELTKVTGNQMAANRWIDFFVGQGVWSECVQSDGSRSYTLTDLGSRLYGILRDPDALRVLISHTRTPD